MQCKDECAVIGFTLILLLLGLYFPPTGCADYLFLGDFVNLHLVGLAVSESEISGGFHPLSVLVMNNHWLC